MKASFKTALILFFTGFILGPIGDYFHLKTGTTLYPSEVYQFYFWGLPFWVPLLFGTAGLAVGMSHLSFDQMMGSQHLRPGAKNLRRVLLGLAIFLGAYILSGYLPVDKGFNNDFILFLIAILTWALFDWTWQGLVLGFLTGIVGTLVEMTLIHLEIFSYLPPRNNLWGVASWLPWLYFTASVTVGNLGRFLNHSFSK